MVAQQHGIAEKEAVANKGVALDATKPPAAPRDPLKEKDVSSTMEIVLATLLVPACERPRPRPPFYDVIGPNPREWVESCYCLSKWRFD